MSSISEYYEYAKLATAAYVNLDGKPIDGATVATLADDQGRLPMALARQLFVANSVEAAGKPVWSVSQNQSGKTGYVGNDDTGFAATLFERTENGITEKVLALRGTEGGEATGLWQDLTRADLAQIGLLGMALSQTVSMINFILRLRADAGADVQQLVLNTSLNPPSGHWVRTEGSVPGTFVYLSFTTNSASGAGLGLIGANEKITVTGHSLGGHLAAMAARLFPDLVNMALGSESHCLGRLRVTSSQSVPPMTRPPRYFVPDVPLHQKRGAVSANPLNLAPMHFLLKSMLLC